MGPAALHSDCHEGAFESAAARIRVFLAEDSQAIRERVRGLLHPYGIDVVGEAATPDASIRAIHTLLPDVVVLDVHLQGGSGLQVLRDIRTHAPRVAFVVLSNNNEPAYRQRYLGDGASEFLDKSTEFERLPDAVAHAHTRGQSGPQEFSQGVPPCP